jgi:hypothetical protein
MFNFSLAVFFFIIAFALIDSSPAVGGLEMHYKQLFFGIGSFLLFLSGRRC